MVLVMLAVFLIFVANLMILFFDCVSVSCFNLRRPSFCCAYYFLTLQGIDAAAMTGSVRTLNQKHTYLY